MCASPSPDAHRGNGPDPATAGTSSKPRRDSCRDVRETVAPTSSDRRHSAILRGSCNRSVGRSWTSMRLFMLVRPEPRPDPRCSRSEPLSGSAANPGPASTARTAAAPRSVREARSAPRTGPPPAGNEATVFPQPAVSSAAGRPTQHPCKRSPKDRARAHGRAHGHTPGARGDTPDGTPFEGRHGRTDRARTRRGARVRAGRRVGTGRPHAAPSRSPRPARDPAPPRPGAAPAVSAPDADGLHRPSPAPPPFLRPSSAFPSPGVRPPLARTAPSAPHAVRLPAVPRAWPVRTTIPPYGRLALNGRDAANYAGFTDVLSRAAYSSGLGQMRVRPECRGSSLGRTRYECRAPHR